MSIRIRRALLGILCFLFLAVGSGTTLYSQGWRFNWKTLSPTRVGALYIRSYPAQSLLYLDGKSVPNESWLLERGTLLNSLYPRNYKLTISVSGYNDWSRNLLIRPSLVTEVKYATLIPSKPIIVRGENSTSSLLLSNGTPITQSETAATIGEKTFSPDSLIIIRPDNENVLLKNKNTGKIEVVNPKTGASTNTGNISENLEKELIKSPLILPDPERNLEIIFASARNLKQADLRSGRVATLATSSSLFNEETPFAASNQYLLWGNGSNGTTFMRRDSLEKESLTFSSNIKKVLLERDAAIILLLDGSVSIARFKGNGTSPIASDAEDIILSPDGKRLLVEGRSSIEIIPLENKDDDYFRIALPNLRDIKAFEWSNDGEHIFIRYETRTEFLELRDSGLENIQVISKTGETAYDSENNRLYAIEDEHLVYYQFAE